MNSLSDILEAARLTHRRVLVVGLGITGVETARVLQQRGSEVVIVEKIAEERFRATSKYFRELDRLRAEGVEIYFGVDGERIAPHVRDAALVIVSPGVSLESSIIGSIKRRGTPYVSELELRAHLHHGKVVVVTGSNGKSTTVTLLDRMLRRAGHSTHVCGTLSSPSVASNDLSVVSQSGDAIMLTAASSYQLEACATLKPDVSVVLNISDNHLERHGSLERYAAAVGRAIRSQSKGDLSVMNGDDPLVRELSRSCQGEVSLFGSASEGELAALSSSWARIPSGDAPGEPIVVSFQGVREEYPTDHAQLIGRHNRYNIAAALLVARRFGVDPGIAREVVVESSPLEHRLEVVWREGRRVIINDSKSTTVAASLAGLSTVFACFPSLSVTLMIGGLSKAGSWAPLLRTINEHPSSRARVVCFGHDRSLLANHCRSAGIEPIVSPSMREAALEAFDTVNEGGVVLFSPGCSSFDEFIDFEHRGEMFKRYAMDNLAQRASGAL